MQRLLIFSMLAVALPFQSVQAQATQGQGQGQTQGQGQATAPPTVKGTVTEIKTQGRTQVLVVANDEGKTLEIPLTNRIPVDIKGDGDKGFVREGAFIGAEGVLTNKMIFVKTVNVLIPAKGQKVPRGKIGKAPRRAGGSQNAYQVMGTIQALKPNPDYPEYTMLALNVAGRAPVVNLEKNYNIKVMSNDPSYIKEGMPAVLDGRFFRGKFQVTKVTINKTEPFSSEEVFGAAASEGGASPESQK